MREGPLLATLAIAASLAGCAGLAPTGPATPAGSGGAGLFGSAPSGVAAFFARGRPRPSTDPAAPEVTGSNPGPISPAVFAAAGSAESDPPYTLDSGDRLRVIVFGQDGITNSYIVDAGGNIMLPLIGPVRARGLTNRALAGSIAERLRAGFIREPHVAVEIESYRPFFILGEVTAPGQYPFVPNMTAETAVAIAGGFTPRASRNAVQISRALDGQPARNTVPLTMPVRPGDTITVSERWF